MFTNYTISLIDLFHVVFENDCRQRYNNVYIHIFMYKYMFM